VAASFRVRWAEVILCTPNLLKSSSIRSSRCWRVCFPVCPNIAPFDYWKSGQLTLFKSTANICRFLCQNDSVVRINHLLKIVQLLLSRLPGLVRSKRWGVDPKRSKSVTAFEHSWNIDVIKARTNAVFLVLWRA